MTKCTIENMPMSEHPAMQDDDFAPSVCGCCLFSEEAPLGFLCKFNAPICGVSNQPNVIAAAQWPLVQGGDWCGEFVPYNVGDYDE